MVAPFPQINTFVRAAGTVLVTSVFYAGLSGLHSGALLYGVLLLTRCSQSVVMSATGPASAILDGRPYAKEVARTSESRCVHSLASKGGKAGAIAENSSVASRLAAP